MSVFCCCTRGDEYEEYSLPSNLIYRYCVCLRFFFHQLLGAYSTVIPRLEGRSVSLPIQSASALTATGFDSELGDNSLDEIHLSMTRQSSFTSEQRYSPLQRNGLVSRRDKLTPHFLDDSMPLRMNVSSSGAESLDSGKKWDEISSEVHSKYNVSESSEKVLDQSIVHGILYVQPSSEDEDVCPTCLDEYTLENPKIMTRCSHHFHLGCIYEWLERSESCPICGKEMEFCESP